MLKSQPLLRSGLCLAGVVALAACGQAHKQDESSHDNPLGGFELAGDAQHNHDHDAPSGEGEIHTASLSTTIKPGADVRFSHELAKNTIVGGPQLVQLGIEEAYSSGQLEVEIVKHNGLRVLSSKTKRLNLAAGDNHTWQIEYEPLAQGRYYIGIVARVMGDRATAPQRAYSIPIYVGDVTGYKPQVRGLKLQQDGDGQPIVTMQARETIRQAPAEGQ